MEVPCHVRDDQRRPVRVNLLVNAKDLPPQQHIIHKLEHLLQADTCVGSSTSGWIGIGSCVMVLASGTCDIFSQMLHDGTYLRRAMSTSTD
nr:hypothetical protein CFP56_09569 [Quercus suber]